MAKRLDMDAELVLPEIGIYRPTLTGVDICTCNSPHADAQAQKKSEGKQQK